MLAELGAWDLDPRGSADELEAAAALCRSAGWWAVPHPVAERLARPRDVDVDGLVVVAGDGSPSAVADAVAGLALRWVAVDLDGRRSRATPRPTRRPSASPAFVAAARRSRPLDDERRRRRRPRARAAVLDAARACSTGPST